MTFKPILAACGSIALVLAFVASAQERPQSGALEEIVVTAQKREQRLQDVGIAVTVFSGNEIRDLGFTNTTDIVTMTPGLNYTVPNAESSQINFFLRGVGLNDFADANENPVAVYVDDVYHPAMGGLSFQLYDMERVEVLRGPQGTLFGRNTTGGLVHFISKRPTKEFEGYAQLSGGRFGEIKFEGALSGPLTDGVEGRLSVATNKNDGWTKNRFPGAPTFNETNAVAARGQLQFDRSDSFKALLLGYYSDNDATVGAWQHQSTDLVNGESVPLGPTQTGVGVDCNVDGVIDANDARPNGTDCFGYADTDGNPWAGDFNRHGKVKVKSNGGTLNLDWTLGGAKLTSISAYQTVDRLQSEDTDAGPTIFQILPTFQAKTDTFTQEFRLGGGDDHFNWLAGLFYFDNKVDGHYLLDLTSLGFIFFDAIYTQKSESEAAFGQIEYALADSWKLIAGVRYAHDSKRLNYLNVDTSGIFDALYGSDVAFDFSPATVGDLAREKNDSVSGKLELDFKPHDDLLLYGSISRGTKAAGFNVGFLDQTQTFASNTVETIPYGPEKLTSFEVGFKSTIANRTRLNGAAFYYDYKDFQTFRFELLNQVIFNTDATVYGVDLELQSSPTEHLDLSLGFNYLDATAKNIPRSSDPADGFRDRRMVASPKISANAMLRYHWPVGPGKVSVQAWGNYQSEEFFDIQNVPVSRQPGFALGNLRVAYTGADDRWEAAAFVHNIANKAHLSYTFDFTATFGFNQQAYGPPRWYGAELRYKF